MPLFHNSIPCEKCGAPIQRRSFRLQPLRCPNCKEPHEVGCLWALLSLPLAVAVGGTVAALPGILLPGFNLGDVPGIVGFLTGIDIVALFALAGHYRTKNDDLRSRNGRIGLIATFGLVALRFSRGLDLGWRGTLIIANAWFGLLVVPRVVDWFRVRHAARLAPRAETDGAERLAAEFEDPARPLRD